MKNALLPRQAEVLRQLASGRTLLAFDFDGTLAPIVPSRDKAAMRSATRALFARVCELFPTAVISGRARADASARLGGARVKYVVGSHGVERGSDSVALKGLLDEARGRLQQLLVRWPGLELEDKGFSLALHLRAVRRPAAARAAIRRVVARLSIPLRVIGGKQVINLLPRASRDKGDALLELFAQEGAQQVLYVGDDVTDEDVFDLRWPERLVSVRVGRSKRSAASYYLPSQLEIDGLLRHLIGLKS